MSSRRLLPLAFALVVVLSACSPTADRAEPAPATSESAAEPITGDTTTTTAVPVEPDSVAGEVQAPEFPSGLDWLNTATPLSLEELRGKVVLLDFWTYGCINCIHILPDLERLEAEYADELVVIGVHSAKFVNESATENIRQVILRYDIEHPVVNDRDFEVWQAWGAQAWPTTVLIDPAGNIVGGHAGEGVYDVISPVIASLVDEFSATDAINTEPFQPALERDRQPSRILSFPGKVHVVPNDSRLFIADSGHHRIVVSDRITGDVLAVYGNGRAGFADGVGVNAQFDSPQGLALDADGVTLYVADTNNHTVRAIDTATGEVTTLLGTGRLGWPPTGGVAPGVDLNSPWDVLVDGSVLYIAMAGHHQIWSMGLENGIAVPLVGSGREGVLNGALDQAELAQPSGLAIDGSGRLYFADSESSSIRYADVASPGGETGLVAGAADSLFEFGDTDGVGAAARLQHPLGVVIWEPEGVLLVADTYNSRLRRIDPVTQEVTTFLGGSRGWADGTDPEFYEPGGIAIDGDTLYVADTNNHAIRVVDLPTGDTSTIVLKGIEAFEPRADDADYRGVLVTLDPVHLAAGDGEIVLDLVLPAGYKLNGEAPSSLLLTVEGEAISLADDARSVDLTGATLPASVAAEFFATSADLIGDLTAVYCRDDATSLCLIEQVRFRVAVTVGTGTMTQVVLPYAIEIPDAADG